MPVDLKSSERLFERTLDSLPDGVLLVSAKREILYANPALARIWNIPPEMMRQHGHEKIFEHVCGQTCDPEAFRRGVVRLYDSTENSEDEIILKDGPICLVAVYLSLTAQRGTPESGYSRT